MEINNDKNYWCYSGGSYLVEFVLPGWMINEICHPGPNDADVERNAESDIVKNAFASYTDEQLRKTYNEVCYENNNPYADRREMIEYLLWDAAWNLKDSTEQEIEEAEA